MIKSIELFNFESHKHSLVTFDSKFHVITGESDCGKSGIRRALFWVMRNKGSRKSIRSWWCENNDETKVILTTDKHVITRIVTKTKNEYHMDGEEYKAFNKEVPTPIAEALNVNDINMGSQFEGHFLLNKPAGAVAKFFNGIIGLEDIDTSLGVVKSLKNDKKSTIKVLDRELKENEFIIDEYGNYARINKRIKVIKKAAKLETDLEDDITKLEDMKVNITASHALIDTRSSSSAKLNKYIRKCEKAVDSHEKAVEDLDNLEDLASGLVDGFAKVEAFDDRGKLKKMMTDVKFFQDGYSLAFNDLDTMIDAKEDILDVITDITELELSHKKTKEEFDSHMEGKCPLCEK